MPGLELKPLALKTFQQSPVVGIYAKQFRQLGQLARALQPQQIALLEADIRPHERYLMERFITAGVWVEGGRTEGSTIVGCRLKPAPDFRPALSVVSLDIETSEHEELYSIALDSNAERVVFMLGEPPAESSPGSALELDFALIYCPSRKVMLEKLNAWFERHDPDVVIGWNVIQFDLRVLQKRQTLAACRCCWAARAGLLHGAHTRVNKAIGLRLHPAASSWMVSMR